MTKFRFPRILMTGLIAVATASAVLLPVAANAAEPAAASATVHPFSGYGYVSEGNLRTNPTQDSPIIDTIDNQWVVFTCWIDGGYNGFGSDRWFKAQYFSKVGYMSSGVVTSQPSLPQC